MVDLDDVTIIIERFGRTLKRLFIEAGIKPEEINLYAFSTLESEKIKQHCMRGNFKFFVKPTKSEQIQFFRHMAFPDEKVDKIIRESLDAVKKEDDLK